MTTHQMLLDVFFYSAWIALACLIVDPTAQRCSEGLQRYRITHTAAVQLQVPFGSEAPSPPAAPSAPADPHDGPWLAAATLGLLFFIVLLICVPMNMVIMAPSFDWALNRIGEELIAFDSPFGGGLVSFRESHAFALAMSFCLGVFGSFYMHCRDRHASSANASRLHAGQGGPWPQRLMLLLLLIVLAFVAIVAGFAGYFRSGEVGITAWMFGITNAVLAELTAIGELLGGALFIHHTVLGSVTRARSALQHAFSRPKQASVLILVPKRPNWIVYLGAAVDTLIDPLRRLDCWLGSYRPFAFLNRGQGD